MEIAMTDIPKIAQLRDHLSISETVTGLILSGKQTVTGFNSEYFSGDYAKMIQDIKLGVPESELVIKYGNTIIQTARHAAKSVNGLGTELDWREVIHKSYKNQIIADELQKALKQLERGESDKLGDTLRRINATHSQAQKLRSVRANEIQDEYTPMIKSGSLAIDTHIGGLPSVGVMVLGAKTYTGKTTVAISILDNYLREYPDREALFVTLEDMNEGWKFRAKTILGNRAGSFWQRIHVMEFAKNMDEVIEEASRFENIGLIVVDFLDLMAKENDLSAFEELYRTASMGSKTLAAQSKFRQMPVIMLAQFGKTLYSGGVPTPHVLKYTGEDKAYHICLLYHAENDFYADNDDSPYVLPPEKGKAYMIYWKVKNARPHDGEFPGAIQLPWEPRTGYALNNEGIWFSLATETRRETPKKNRR